MRISTVTLTTAKASGYLQQLCKHFGHHMQVDFTTTTCAINFPFGSASLEANDEALTMRVEGEEQNIEKLETVMASHLERFAFRENLRVTWNKTT